MLLTTCFAAFHMQDSGQYSISIHVEASCLQLGVWMKDLYAREIQIWIYCLNGRASNIE